MIKYQSYPKSTKIDAFEQKICRNGQHVDKYFVLLQQIES